MRGMGILPMNLALHLYERSFLDYEKVTLHGRDTHATEKVFFLSEHNKKYKHVVLLYEKDSDAQ